MHPLPKVSRGVSERVSERVSEKYQPEWRENHSDYQSSYWSLIPTNSHQFVYYQYAKFAKTLSDDEIQVLVLKICKS